MVVLAEILMDGAFSTVYIAVGTGTLDEKLDDKIFFYVDSEEDLKALMKEDNGEDFQVIGIYDTYETTELM